MLADSDLYWLAGLLEGEGYFGMIPNNVGGKTYRYPRIGVTMTDEDVVSRVAELWQIRLQVIDPRKDGRSKLLQYRAHISGSRAVLWMEKLKPLMGNRRQRQIEETLAIHNSKEPAVLRQQRASIELAKTRFRSSTGQFIEQDALGAKIRGSARGTHGTLSSLKYCGPPACDACRQVYNAWRRQRYAITHGKSMPLLINEFVSS